MAPKAKAKVKDSTHTESVVNTIPLLTQEIVELMKIHTALMQKMDTIRNERIHPPYPKISQEKDFKRNTHWNNEKIHAKPHAEEPTSVVTEEPTARCLICDGPHFEKHFPRK